MKKIICIYIGLIPFFSFSQCLDSLVTYDFEATSSDIFIDASQSNNLWQVGHPQKILFNSSKSGTKAIVTDTLNSYPVDNLSSFILKIDNTQSTCGWTTFNEIGFWHQYSTDSLKDGGFIECSIDSSYWFNIAKYDTLMWYGGDIFYTTNIYGINDTINGNIPAFTGNSSGWQYSDFVISWYHPLKNSYPPDTFYLRFNFKSSANSSEGKDGWMIDDIQTSSGLVWSVEENSKNNFIKTYPSPTKDILYIANLNKEFEISSLAVFNMQGKEVIKSVKKFNNQFSIDTSSLVKGIYLISLTDTKGNVVTKKLVKD